MHGIQPSYWDSINKPFIDVTLNYIILLRCFTFWIKSICFQKYQLTTYLYLEMYRTWQYLWQYLGLRSGGPKQVTVGISSFVGFCSASDSAWVEVEGGADVVIGVLCSLFGGGCGDAFWPWQLRLRLGERQRRRALNWRSSSPKRFPREVRRTGLLKLGNRRLRRERVAGDRWKESSGSSLWVSTIDGSLGSCKSEYTDVM